MDPLLSLRVRWTNGTLRNCFRTKSVIIIGYILGEIVKFPILHLILKIMQSEFYLLLLMKSCIKRMRGKTISRKINMFFNINVLPQRKSNPSAFLIHAYSKLSHIYYGQEILLWLVNLMKCTPEMLFTAVAYWIIKMPLVLP